MGQYHVVPDGSGWAVKKNGRTLSNHRKKRRAVSAARSKASSGNQMQIHRADGSIQNTVTIR